MKNILAMIFNHFINFNVLFNLIYDIHLNHNYYYFLNLIIINNNNNNNNNYIYD